MCIHTLGKAEIGSKLSIRAGRAFKGGKNATFWNRIQNGHSFLIPKSLQTQRDDTLCNIAFFFYINSNNSLQNKNAHIET